jgi:hypothetical protein
MGGPFTPGNVAHLPEINTFHSDAAHYRPERGVNGRPAHATELKLRVHEKTLLMK